MSLNRLVYYSAVIGGWMAFFGWLFAEFVVLRGQALEGTLNVAIMCALVGASIGGGLNVVAGISNRQVTQLLMRGAAGLLGGALGGAFGGAVGNLLTTIDVPRAFGFMLVGMAIGVVEGLYDKSKAKIRNGVLGGAVGGVLGGFVLDWMLTTGSGMSSRATAFVLLGICIGALIGLAQVVLKDAWLTVLDGYGVGRQYIISKERTVLGRGDHLPLPFLGRSNQNIEPEHLSIIRAGGNFFLEDLRSKIGTTVNNQVVSGRVPLGDKSLIRFGANLVEFRSRTKQGDGPPPEVRQPPDGSPTSKPPAGVKPPPPPPMKSPIAKPKPPPQQDSQPTTPPTTRPLTRPTPPPPPPPPPPRRR
jgi:pSer/pThr/pTyr-binding forkhead associated (FHA) protein